MDWLTLLPKTIKFMTPSSFDELYLAVVWRSMSSRIIPGSWSSPSSSSSSSSDQLIVRPGLDLNLFRS